MASDRQQFTAAVERWDAFHEAQVFSAPPERGCVAVVTTCAYDLSAPDEMEAALIHEHDWKTFLQEATEISMALGAMGRQVRTYPNANVDEFYEALKDPHVSDMIVIGHGSFTSLCIDGPQDESIDWLDIAMATNHLKLGRFIQRTCGRFDRKLSVPLGLFATSNPRDVIAPVGSYFAPATVHHPSNQLLKPVTNKPRLSYKQIKQAFPMQKRDSAMEKWLAASNTSGITSNV